MSVTGQRLLLPNLTTARGGATVPIFFFAPPYIGECYRAATLKLMWIDFTGYNIPEPSEAIFYSRGFRQNPIADLRSEANVNKYEISG